MKKINTFVLTSAAAVVIGMLSVTAYSERQAGSIKASEQSLEVTQSAIKKSSQAKLLKQQEPIAIEKNAPAPQPLTLEEAKMKGLSKHTFPRQHNALVGEDGVKFVAQDTGKGYKLFVVDKDSKQPAKDGIYKIQGGGSVKVEKGWIIWSDATINSRFPNRGYVSGVIGLG